MPNVGGAQCVLDRLSSRTHLTEIERATVLGLRWEQAQADAHGEIVQRGTEVSSCCVVLDGLVARTGGTVDGHRQITAFYIPGDMPDLQALMMPCATATLQAICTSRILRVSQASIRDVMMRFPGIAEALWRELVAEASIASEWIVNVGCRPARQRLAHLFCEMGHRNVRCPREQFDYAFPVTQGNLAEAAGITNVHVNRVLQDLRKDGLLDLKGHRIYVYDWQRLVEEAGFDPTYLKLLEPEERIRYCPEY